MSTTQRPQTWPAADFHPQFASSAPARIAQMEPGAGVGALRQIGGLWQVYVAVTPTASSPSNWAWVAWDASHQAEADRYARYGAGWEDPFVTWEAVNNVYTWIGDLQGRTPSAMEYTDYGYRPDAFDALRLAYLAKHPVVPAPAATSTPPVAVQPTSPPATPTSTPPTTGPAPSNFDFAGLFGQLAQTLAAFTGIVQQASADAAAIKQIRDSFGGTQVPSVASPVTAPTSKPNETLLPRNPAKRKPGRPRNS